jgi:hypothetical protein
MDPGTQDPSAAQREDLGRSVDANLSVIQIEENVTSAVIIVNSHSRIGLIRVQRGSRKFVLPWLIPTYLLIGSYAARSIIELLEQQLTITKDISDDPDGSNENGDQPYWTSHKHITSDDRFRTDDVALFQVTRIVSVFSIYPYFSPVAPSIPFAQLSDHVVERAPPSLSLFS